MSGFAMVFCQKPQLELYQKFVHKFRLYPQECLFIDDTYENVEAVKAIGMYALRFTNTAQISSEILQFFSGE
jgi:HAD superfamily hydrolase (TIGR01509 family)